VQALSSLISHDPTVNMMFLGGVALALVGAFLTRGNKSGKRRRRR